MGVMPVLVSKATCTLLANTSFQLQPGHLLDVGCFLQTNRCSTRGIRRILAGAALSRAATVNAGIGVQPWSSIEPRCQSACTWERDHMLIVMSVRCSIDNKKWLEKERLNFIRYSDTKVTLQHCTI